MGMENSFSLKLKDGKEILVNYFCNFSSLHTYVRENFDGKVREDIYKCSSKDLKLLKYELEGVYKELYSIGHSTVSYYDEEGYPPIKKDNFSLLNSQYFRPTRDYNGGKILSLYQTVCALLMLLENDFDKQLEVMYVCSY